LDYSSNRALLGASLPLLLGIPLALDNPLFWGIVYLPELVMLLRIDPCLALIYLIHDYD